MPVNENHHALCNDHWPGVPDCTGVGCPCKCHKEVSTVKQVIVIRKDLKMRRGKEIAQGAHASIAFLTRDIQKRLTHEKPGWVDYNLILSPKKREWIENGFTKVCLQVDSYEALMDVYQKAKAAGLEVHLVTDAGKTEFQGNATETCLAIGPDDAEKIDAVTGDLKLY